MPATKTGLESGGSVRLVLEDQGDGWPADHAGRTIVALVIAQVPVEGQQPYLKVGFEPPLELQESSDDTPSGLTLNTVVAGWVRARWVDHPVGDAEVPVSVWFDSDAASATPPAGSPRLWAMCRGTL